MTIGSGIAVFGIWMAVAISVAFGGPRMGILGFFAVFATLFVALTN